MRALDAGVRSNSMMSIDAIETSATSSHPIDMAREASSCLGVIPEGINGPAQLISKASFNCIRVIFGGRLCRGTAPCSSVQDPFC